MILIYIVAALFLIYAILIIYYWMGWRAVPEFRPTARSRTYISVIIPARNEEENITQLLKALEVQSYPKEQFEVIVVDDHSTDQTVKRVLEFRDARLIRLEDESLNSYKKKAIDTGIAAAKGELIVTTDADCIPQPQWLETIASFREEKSSVAIAAPVDIDCGPRFLEIFQCMDFMMLQGITAAVVHHGTLTMANGANLAYRKDAFDAVEGFKGIDRVASGDDMLLVHKFSARFPKQYHYLLSQQAIVSTAPARSWSEFFNQRIRWASKFRSYQDKRIFPILLLVYLYNLSFLVLIIAGFFHPYYWTVAGISWISKTLVELPFYYSVSKFFRKLWTVKYFFFMQPVHILYTIIAGAGGQMGRYQWKGRTVK